MFKDKLIELQQALEQLKLDPNFENTNVEFQDMVEDLQFELELQLKEME